jgi:hypothetical protein
MCGSQPRDIGGNTRNVNAIEHGIARDADASVDDFRHGNNVLGNPLPMLAVCRNQCRDPVLHSIAL